MKNRAFLWPLCVALAVAVVGCSALPQRNHNLPPAQRLKEPGPGVGGPGPGVLPPSLPMVTPMAPIAPPTVQILFNKPEGMQVRWDVSGQATFDSTPLVVPGRQNFPVGGIYQLKVTNISLTSREGVELYPTLELGPMTPKTQAFLAHNAIPVQFTDEDFEQVLTGNFVTKVIYLPDPEFQQLAVAGVDTLVSTRLDPGDDPIVEADRRGTIMAIVRLGNKDIEMANAAEASQVAYQQGGQPMTGRGAPPAAIAAAPPMSMGPTGLMPHYISGVTGPTYGIPYVGTQIGLPGPPHIPFGSPARLQKTSMINRTPVHIPRGTRHLRMHLRQQPGYSYPKPPSRVFIREQSIHPAPAYGQPFSDRNRLIVP